jgi:hypothetical protein
LREKNAVVQRIGRGAGLRKAFSFLSIMDAIFLREIRMSNVMTRDASNLRVPARTLDEPDDEELAYAVIAPAKEVVDIYNGPRALIDSMRPLTPGQRALLALQWCVWEVANGGFSQFYMNPTRVVAQEAFAGFERIAAHGAAETLMEALSILKTAPATILPSAPQLEDRRRRPAFRTLLERLEPIEDRFFALMRTEIYPRAAAYIRDHPEEFVR